MFGIFGNDAFVLKRQTFFHQDVCLLLLTSHGQRFLSIFFNTKSLGDNPSMSIYNNNMSTKERSGREGENKEKKWREGGGDKQWGLPCGHQQSKVLEGIDTQ